ncbi:UNVERIFIED_CONTAM: (2Fe-2S) ferredoxin [Paenibacillus sp. PvR008]
MAAPKKMEITNTENTNNEPSQKTEKEIALEDQVAKLTSLVEDLLEKNKKIETSHEEIKTEAKKVNSLFESVEDKLDIDPREYIRVVSLTNGGLNLTGTTSTIRFNDFGSSKTITFEDVRAIVDNHTKFAHEGAFLIQSEKAVKALYLDDVYQKFVSRETIDNIISLDIDEIIDTLNSVSPTLKENIIERIVVGIATNDNKFQDRYKIDAIGKLVKQDLYELAKVKNNA